MAANSKSTQGIAILGRRVAKQIWTVHSSRRASASSSAARRAAHTSAYDKNPDDQLRPSAVPEDVIDPQSDKYWAPHPQTGVFGPVTEKGGEGGFSTSPDSSGQGILEEKAWFRPTSLEDLEKPHHV
ncbi:late embryogenesis abundant protein At5g17165 [Mercurialis annua]|uniref:late embryogenesis abundant protein At5g17165 n=1 Tax=Mercurialis annua TaxID=3986 RepID=UPI00215F8469|nr:late embryogenesis abundant protein At5g17165 [Mercurialis annua]